MNRKDLTDIDDIFIVKVTGTHSRTINIPDAVCDFCDVDTGDIIKLKILEIKPKKKKNEKKS